MMKANCFKAVKLIHGKLFSSTVPFYSSFSVDYEVGKRTVPKTGRLFVFDFSKEGVCEALNMLGYDDLKPTRVYLAHAEVMIDPITDHVPSVGDDKRMRSYWNNPLLYDSTSKQRGTWFTMYPGFKMCSAITLIEEAPYRLMITKRKNHLGWEEE